jgi:mono/diheme cytochrome c family protein
MVRALPFVVGAAALAWGCGAFGADASALSDAELYSRYCARCHGEDGRGDRRSVNLNPALDLTRSSLGRNGDRQQIYRRIAFGYGPMPAFSHKLGPKDLERLTQYSLQFAETR